MRARERGREGERENIRIMLLQPIRSAPQIPHVQPVPNRRGIKAGIRIERAEYGTELDCIPERVRGAGVGHGSLLGRCIHIEQHCAVARTGQLDELGILVEDGTPGIRVHVGEADAKVGLASAFAASSFGGVVPRGIGCDGCAVCDGTGCVDGCKGGFAGLSGAVVEDADDYGGYAAAGIDPGHGQTHFGLEVEVVDGLNDVLQFVLREDEGAEPGL